MSNQSLPQQERLNLVAASDQMLLELTREGMSEAFGELWSRHSGAVLAAVRSYTGYEPEDLMQDAFAKVYASVLTAGELPASFRAYVATAARRLAIDQSRREKGVILDAYDDQLDDRAFDDSDFSERVIADSTTAQAFRELPTRQREALWYRDVEDLPVQEIARYVGMSPNSTTVLIRRARDAFKTAWVSVQLSPQRDLAEDCRGVVPLLAKFARGKLSAVDHAKVELHLLDCSHCAILAEEADDLHQKLALVLLPLLLLGGAPGYLAWVQSKKNRVPLPTQANYLPIKLIGGKTVPRPQSPSGRALPLSRRRASYLVAGATALLLAGGVAAAVLLPGEEFAGAAGPQPMRDAAEQASPRSDHSPGRSGSSDVSTTDVTPGDEAAFQVPGGLLALTPVTTVAGQAPHTEAILAPVVSPVVSLPDVIPGAVLLPVLPAEPLLGPTPDPLPGLTPVPVPEPEVIPEPGDPSELPKPPPEPGPDGPVKEPLVDTFPTHQDLGMTVLTAPFRVEFQSTAGAQVYLRAILPRENWSNDQWTTVLTADADGWSSFDFPAHRGRTVSLYVVQEYATADGTAVPSTQGNTYSVSLAIPVE